MRTRYRIRARGAWLIGCLAIASLHCGDDGTEADELGVGAQCVSSDGCLEGQTCLSFKGGYCGVRGCMSDADCPEASACVSHDDGVNYCFRLCVDKSECNVNREPDNEANCSSNVTFADGKRSAKACVPPSG